MSNYKITIKASAELVYYISSDDIDVAIEHALGAPYKEWQVSEFDMPNDDDIDVREIRED
jgi:hypothetical protein